MTRSSPCQRSLLDDICTVSLTRVVRTVQSRPNRTDSTNPTLTIHVRLLGHVDMKSIQLGRGKPPRIDPFREQDIQFFVSPAPGLGKTIISPDPGQDGRRAPYETRVTPEIQRLGVEKVRLQHAREDGKDIIRVPGEADRLLSETSRPDLGGERPTQLSHRNLKREGPDESEARLCHGDELMVSPGV